jgi:Right handed beta helix region
MGSLGHGLHVTDAANVELTRVAIEGNRTNGVFLFGRDAHVTLTDASIVDTEGRGVWVNLGTSATLINTTVESNVLTGLEVSAGGAAELTDVVVRGTRANPGGRGDGVWVDGGRLIGQRVRVEGSANLGVGVTAAPAFTVLTDFVSSGDFGVGVNVGGTLVLDHAWLHDTLGGALNVRGGGATATLTDVVVEDVRTTPGNLAASGILVLRGGVATLRRARIERCTGSAVAVVIAGSTLNASDLQVLDTQPGSDGEGGYGIVDQSGELGLERVRVQGARSAGVLVDGPRAHLTLSDVEVADTLPPASQGGLYGDGLVVSGGANATGARLRLTGNHDVGVLVSDPASRAVFSEVLVRATSLTCTNAALCEGHAASGLTVLDGASAALSRFLLIANGGFGVQVGPTAQLDLSAGEISYHQVGVSVLEPAFDLTRLETDVVFPHNEQKVSSLTVPLPRVPRPPQVP